MTERWIAARPAKPRARVRLLCFPYAGAGAVLYHGWHELLTDEVDVCAIEGPGRWARSGEAAVEEIAVFVQAVADACVRLLDLPFVLFGHSLGALQAFELAHHLRERVGVVPRALVVSARAAPCASSISQPITHLPDAAFLDTLRSLYGALDPALTRDQSLRALLVRVVRSDLRMLEAYRYVSRARLSVPILALGGLSDHTTPLDDLLAWRSETSAAFRLQMFDGAHFFIKDCERAVLQTLRSVLLSR